MIAPDDQTAAEQSGGCSAKVSLRSKLWRWFKLCSRVIIYAPLLLLISLAVLIGTEFGSHISVKLADMFVPDLELSYKSGQINRQLELNYGAWQMNGVAVEVSDLVLAWNPMCLMQKQLCVEQLASSKVNVEIDTQLIGSESDDSVGDSSLDEQAQLDNPETENQEITLPFGITLNSGELKNVTVRVNDMDFNANQLDLSAEWLATGIRASSIYSEGLLVSIPFATDKTDAKQDAADAMTNTASTTAKNQPKTQQTTTPTEQSDQQKWAMANLPQVFMPIPVFVENLDINNAELILGPRKDNFQSLHLSGSYQQFLINIDDFRASHTYGDVRLLGQMSLIDDYPMEITANAKLNSVAEVPGLKNQDLDISVSQGFTKLKSHITGSGQFDFDIESSIALAKPELPYTLNLSAKQLQWPLKQADYVAQNIKLTSKGDLHKQQASVQALFSSPFQPTIDLDTQFSHQGSQLTFTKLHARNSKLGELTVQGALEYGQQLAWDAKVASQQFDISQLTLSPDSPLPASEITGPFNTKGQFNLTNNNWQVELSNAKLNGHIMHYPLEVDGDLALNQQWFISSNGLNVNALQSHLYVKGTVDKNWALNGTLTVPDLSLWQAQANGTINADIAVSGENEHPDLGVNLTAEDLQFQSIELNKLSLNGHYKPFDNHDFSAEINLVELKYQDLELASINLNAEGDLAKQALQINSKGDLGLTTALTSQFDEKKQLVDAQINQLTLRSKLGDVSLEKPLKAEYSLNNQTGLLQAFCLSHQSGNLCANTDTKLGLDGNTSLQFNGDIGKLVKPWLPQSLDWTGPASLTTNLQWFADKKPTGNLELQLNEGNIDFKATNNSNVAVGYKSVQIRSKLDEKQLQTSVALESHDIASLDANLGINVTPDRAMKGKFSLHKINLKALAVLVPELEVLEGVISSELNVAGSLTDPQVSGEIALNNGAIMATANPTLLEDIDLDFIFAGKKAQIDGQLKMGEGLAYVDGQLDWAQQKLKGAFDVKGNDLAVIQPPLAILNVGTDLHVNFTNESFDVTGDINVPSGKITIVQLPEGGVAVSKDVVFEDSLATKEAKASPLAVSAQVNLNVGDNLRVDGMGLAGKLQGKLELKQDPFRPPLMFGEIKVVDGNYKFMGQTLEIRAGEMQFIGPIDVPNLNIEAVREIKDEDVIAGVRITGTPMKPIVNLFSNPTKEQAEILNYIVRGTGLSNNSVDQNSGLMMGAALTLSNQIGGGAIGNIGNTATGLIEKIGFSNVQLDANDDGRFAISGFIGDNLMVKYGVGVFNPGYEMTVRYYLLSQLYLETVSGTIEQSLDLYYSFDL
ncbi:autotransporter assembly complex protein TamB [Shewanella fidelis]|uniref:Translocation/assembly module TamB domain-containing protein n=1 Tax=Shewanella fidelis TaxID=173509 RepID=A0AAW8NLK4_9GAMM|nr:translocation/assembly module TamB domain-containing protein [Shewanella fidelis]MDR8524102.1 translocation/assembly module TamB domain-containing protein [Shewanella fidelis]MDW4810649.1 translocation/assembly module TamB domain-containing protein [Shewanella fidelis]MDW4814770.1 translocation/assembly module TamB domain-containing protein [Shewanella fidelis]MDW4818860.1 translocation/assembly module TamB domain-containing protein [Shewanella fidelis]MDW4823463.1 translocation/assembly mo